MIPGDKVYSPQLRSSFTVKEVKGNAIITEEGATLSAKMVSKNVSQVFKGLYTAQKEQAIDQLVQMSKVDGGETLYEMVQDNGMPLTTFLQILKRL